MPYSLEDKLVIAVSTSAVFDFSEADRVFREGDENAYRQFHRTASRKLGNPASPFP